MVTNVIVNIPDGDYCENCQFSALDGAENSICTLFRCKLKTSCEKHRELFGDCGNSDCLDCPACYVSGYAKCDKCRGREEIEKRSDSTKVKAEKDKQEAAKQLKAEIQKLNEGLFWMGDSAEKRVSVREIIKLRNILEKAYYSISEKTKGKEK